MNEFSDVEQNLNMLFEELNFHQKKRHFYFREVEDKDIQFLINVNLKYNSFYGYYGMRSIIGEKFSTHCIREFGKTNFDYINYSNFSFYLRYDFFVNSIGKLNRPRFCDLNIARSISNYRSIILSEFVDYIININDLHDLYQFLIMDRYPFFWYYSNSAIRTAHIYSIGRRLNISHDVIKSETSKNLIRHIELAGIEEADRFYSQIRDEWDANWLNLK